MLIAPLKHFGKLPSLSAGSVGTSLDASLDLTYQLLITLWFVLPQPYPRFRLMGMLGRMRSLQELQPAKDDPRTEHEILL